MKNETQGHTPTPWHAVEIEFGKVQLKSEVNGNGAVIITHDGSEKGRANVRLIVRAVSAHEDLLAALAAFLPLATDAKCIASFKWTQARDNARAAIAKARGQTLAG